MPNNVMPDSEVQSVFQGDFYDALEHSVRKNSVIKIFCVAGKTSFGMCGAKDVLDDLENIEYIVYNDFSPNPKYEDVVGGIDALNSFKPDVVLAIGGGSAMDIAKLIVVFVDKDLSNFTDYMQGKMPLENIVCPLWVAPTTSGSGSESTHFAVVYYNDKKYSVAVQALIPSVVFLDPVLTYTTPRQVAVCAGIDVMCQAMESYWAVGGTDESRGYGKEAMQLCLNAIIPAIDGERKERRDMQYAGFLAGKAINISKTTAGHAFSYYLTQKYNVMHGHAVAVMLRYTFKYALKYGDKDGLKKCENIADILNINMEELPQFLEQMMEQFELKHTVQDLGLKTSEQIKTLCESVNIERLSNNPVAIDLAKFQKIVEG